MSTLGWHLKLLRFIILIHTYTCFLLLLNNIANYNYLTNDYNNELLLFIYYTFKYRKLHISICILEE